MTEINPASLQQQGLTQAATVSERTAVAQTATNSHNLVSVKTAEEVGKIAQKSIGTMPYRIATAGYSAPPKGYETPTKQFLKMLDGELGTRSTAFVTSPTADRGSIDAITSEVTGLNNGKIFYTTAQEYVEYIDPKKFPETIDTTAYSRLPKYVLPNGAEYSRATAEASNVFIATGGRNATVSDFVNAIKKGNKAIILNNPAIDAPVWNEVKGRPENASKYLAEQLEAFFAGKKLPYSEVDEFTTEFLAKNQSKLNKLVKIITLESVEPKSILDAAKKAATFIR